MITTSFLPDTLRSFDYYKNKLPMYLQNSYGFIEHFKIWYKVLLGSVVEDDVTIETGVVGNGDILLNLLNIFADDYLTYIASFTDAGVTLSHPYGTESDILDKIGSIFAVTRHFTVMYIESDVEVTESLSLDNQEFLILIKTQIIKNYCDGTFSQLQGYYASCGLYVYITTSSVESASSYVYLMTSDSDTTFDYSDNIQKMFLSGLLHVDAVGIKYIYSTTRIDGILFWDTINAALSTGWGGTESGTTYIGGEWVA